MNCKYCQKLLDDQGGNYFICYNCDVWIKFDPQNVIDLESFDRVVDDERLTLTIDYASGISYLENMEGDTLWEDDTILKVTPRSVVNKIKIILLFL